MAMCSRTVILPVVAVAFALTLVGSASAASPDVQAMNLQKADVPGAKVARQRATTEKGYVAAYVRSFTFSAPTGGSRLIEIQVETQLAASTVKPSADATAVEKEFRSSAGRKLLKANLAAAAQVKPKAVAVGVPHKVPGFDQGFEAGVSLPVKGGRVYENFIYLRLDRVLVIMVELGLKAIEPPVTAKYTRAIGAHIGTELAPKPVSPPTVTGTAVQRQTLTAAAGTWSAPDATFAYQWQHCDASGANCTDVAGATTQAYAVTSADVGSTLVVVVKASNRFGSPTAPSAATAPVT